MTNWTGGGAKRRTVNDRASIIGEPGLGKSKLLRKWISASEGAGSCPAGSDVTAMVFHTAGILCGPGSACFRGWTKMSQLRNAHPEGRPEDLNIQQHPSLVIVDDLHWVDAESRALIADLIAVSRGLPVMFVLAYRPSFMDRAPSDPPRLHRRLSLQRLGQDEISVLIAALADKMAIVVSPSFTNQVLAKAAGIPLYAGGSTRSSVRSAEVRQYRCHRASALATRSFGSSGSMDRRTHPARIGAPPPRMVIRSFGTALGQRQPGDPARH